MSLFSNCIAVAVRHWLRREVERIAAAEAAGRKPRGDETYGWWRRSRAQNGIVHVGWGYLDPATQQMRMWSFKPAEYVDVPWYRAWTRLMFRGSIVEGDFYVTTQPHPADLEDAQRGGL